MYALQRGVRVSRTIEGYTRKHAWRMGGPATGGCDAPFRRLEKGPRGCGVAKSTDRRAGDSNERDRGWGPLTDASIDSVGVEARGLPSCKHLARSDWATPTFACMSLSAISGGT